MGGLVAGYSLLGTLIFVLGSLVVGARLVWLWRRTGAAPEGLLGVAVLGTAVLGYGTLMTAQMHLIANHGEPSDSISALAAVGWIAHDVGVSASLWFQRRVFRPHEAWARALAVLLIAALWLGFAGLVHGGGLREVLHRSLGWWLHQSVIWTYPMWGVVESLRYWRVMRRRQAVGLGEPLVANRFLLWALALSTTLLATWCASPALFIHPTSELARTLLPVAYVATATCGLVSVSLYWLTFFPPRWYESRVTANAAAPSA